MDKTDNFILSIKCCYFHSCVALLHNPTVKKVNQIISLVISQVLQRQQYCYGNTFPKEFPNAFGFSRKFFSIKRTANSCFLTIVKT